MLTALTSIAKEWRDIGLSLHIEYAMIEKIETDHSTDVKRCLAEVINCWLKENGGERSWSFLCKALRNPLVSRPDVARVIEQTYTCTIIVCCVSLTILNLVCCCCFFFCCAEEFAD